MDMALKGLGHAAAILGIVLCAVAGYARITGSFYVAGYEAMTLFNVGVGVMLFSVLVKLELLLKR